jgi:peptidoglycan/LPS O-acetylase OafA/YrhL
VRCFRTDIQGLRAVAVGLVVADHAGLPFWHGGYVGVDVFFVISGFLITTQLIGQIRDRGRIGLGRFYAHRILRLLPLSSVVVVATLVGAWLWMAPLRLRDIAGDGLASSLYAINVRLAEQGTDYLRALDEPSPFQHYWSLAVEEQFYLLWPLLLILVTLRRTRLRVAAAALVLVTLASFAVSSWLTGTGSPWAYFGLQSRAWELGVGALIALAATRLTLLPRWGAAVLTWLGLGAVVAAGLLYSASTAFPGYPALLPVLGTGAVIAGGCAAPRAGADLLLRLPPAQWIGRLSYGWYLWHWPFVLIGPYALDRYPTVKLKTALVLAALAVAAVSLWAVEDRVRGQRWLRARPRRGLWLGAGLTAGSAAIVVLVGLLPGSLTGYGRAPEVRVTTAAQLTPLIERGVDNRVVPVNLVPPLARARNDQPKLPAACLANYAEVDLDTAARAGCDALGDGTASRVIVLVGDSHAQQWFEPLNAIARQRGLRLVVLTKQACPPPGATIVRRAAPYTECDAWRERALRKIEQLRPERIVVSWLLYGESPVGVSGHADEAWATAWAATARRLTATAARVTLLEDTPYPGIDVPVCVSLHLAAVHRCDSRSLPYADRRRLIARTAQQAGVARIDPVPWFCVAGSCPRIIGNVLVYRDPSHMSAVYSRRLTPLLDRALG